jgi:uncharacterized integral membrane protein
MAQPTNPGTTSGTGDTPSNAGLSSGLIATLSGGALLLVFILQNRSDVTLKFLLWSFVWPLWLLIIVTATLGAMVWFGLGVLRRHRRRVARRAARHDD